MSTKYLLSLSLATEARVLFQGSSVPLKKDSPQPSLESGVAGWLLQCCVDAQRDTQGSWLSSGDGALVGAVAPASAAWNTALMAGRPA